MKIVITYRHEGKPLYPELINIAFESAKAQGYHTVLVLQGGDTQWFDPDTIIYSNRPTDEPLMDWILGAQGDYISSDHFDADSVLFSPDAVINKPLDEVFQKDFDIAVTVRDNAKWPVNNGVIFLRATARDRLIRFFRDCLARCQKYDDSTRAWYGDQLALHEELAAFGDAPYALRGLRLPCEVYNANPGVPGAYVTHYKGPRKEAMRNDFAA